ncbi:MAG: putative DNA binding domain-containing protein [Rhodospirillum sp.]|nr:putative DNA binding domain-containing protein [Rhodospirillum sp.]MCF8488305.1 putative DNA binding domain-containing protein [Rhodospirillum sp.]MCF8503139.1 putative DNA binding domain-containing protein [Rhodospirillum sp.]
MKLNDADLEALLDEIESDQAERKESFKGDAPDKVRQAICAFANDLPNHGTVGVVFIGAKDNGSPSELNVTDELLLQLADIRSDGNILPLPSMTVEKYTLKGAEMAVITVLPADSPPVRYKGRIWIRTGPRRGIASAQDERILNEKRQHRDLPFDLQPVTFATVANLSKTLFESEYLQGAIAPDILAANERTYEERLAASRMIESADRPVPTVLGCIVLSPRARDLIPSNYVQFLRIDGTELADPIKDEEVIDGPLAQMLRRLDDKLEAHIQTAVEIASGPLERRSPDYPLVALQQIVRNALMHRTYEATHTPVRITWFDDRIEIASPGGPYGIVTRQNFGKPGYTDYRNPNLAETMKVLGFVQRFGVGIQTAQKALLNNGNPPAEFSPEDNLVFVTIWRRR